MPSSVSRSTKYAASRSASRCAVATTKNVVDVEASSWKVAFARARKPPKTASQAATKVCRSVMIWVPSTFFIALRPG